MMESVGMLAIGLIIGWCAKGFAGNRTAREALRVAAHAIEEVNEIKAEPMNYSAYRRAHYARTFFTLVPMNASSRFSGLNSESRMEIADELQAVERWVVVPAALATAGRPAIPTPQE